MIFDLVKDYADVLEVMPEEHPRRRILKLLDEAIRRDLHFIDRHPTTFFQCMWNTCWWSKRGDRRHSERMQLATLRIHDLLETWERRMRLEGLNRPRLRALNSPAAESGLEFISTLGIAADDRIRHFAHHRGLIVTVSGNGVVRLWNMLKGQLIKELGFVSKNAVCVRIAPDGRRIAIGDFWLLRIWDIGGFEHWSQGMGGQILDLAFSPDGSQILVASGTWSQDQECRLRIFDIQSGVELASRDLHGHSAGCLSVLGDRKSVLGTLGKNARDIVEWGQGDLESVTELWSYSDCYYSNGAFLSTVSTTAGWVAIALTYGRIPFELSRLELRHLDFPEGMEVLEDDVSRLRSLCFRCDGAMIAASHEDGTIRVWSTEDAVELFSTRLAMPATIIDFNSDDSLLLVEPEEGRLICSHLPIDSATTTSDVRSGGAVSNLQFSRLEDRCVVLCGKDVQLLRPSTGECVANLTGHVHHDLDYLFDPDGCWMATFSRHDTRVGIWNLIDGRSICWLDGHDPELESIVLGIQGGCLGTATFLGKIRVWETTNWSKLIDYSIPDCQVIDLAVGGQPFPLAVAITETFLVDGQHQHVTGIAVWQSDTDSPPFPLPYDIRFTIRRIAFADGGRRLVCSGGSGYRAWEFDKEWIPSEIRPEEFLLIRDRFPHPPVEFADQPIDDYVRHVTADLASWFPDHVREWAFDPAAEVLAAATRSGVRFFKPEPS